jgi:hypothetical protein
MNYKKPCIVAVLIALHVSFITLSYDTEFLFGLRSIGEPIVIHRVLMLLQFLPLIMALVLSRYSAYMWMKSKSLIFLAFSTCISTLFIVNDFASGFYGNISGDGAILPRMRASAHLIAYKDTGRIVVLDPHGEYFLEYIIIHFLSEATGLNYVLAYAVPVRLLLIIEWSLMFVVVYSYVLSKNFSSIFLLLVAATFLIANQGYNYEVSFAPLILIISFLLISKEKRLGITISVMLMVIATLFASLRETLVLTILSVIVILASGFNYIACLSRGRTYKVQLQSLILIAVLGFARVIIFSTIYYFESYINAFFSLIRSIQHALAGGLIVEKGVLSTILATRNPVDSVIDLTAAVSMISLLTGLASLATYYLIYYHQNDPLLVATLIGYVLCYAIPVAQYGVNLMLGYGFDFASSTVFARSFAPLAAIALTQYPTNTRGGVEKGDRLRPVAIGLLILLLSVIIIFAPLTFMARGEVKSAYDVARIRGDPSESSQLGNELYHFIVTNRVEGTLVILDPFNRFLQLYYQLPLNYVTNGKCQVGNAASSAVNTVYSNGVFTALFSPGSIFLKGSV